MARQKKTQSQIDKEKKYEDLQARLQELANKKKISMGDFMKNWNLKNKEKITEMVKLDHTVLIRFGNATIHVFTDKLYL